MERVEFTATDGAKIVGDYYDASGDRFVILLHMMPADRRSWKVVADDLQARGISSLAIDLRGHGESTGGPEGYKAFTDAEQQKSALDVRAAWQWLETRGAQATHTMLAGASIGANLALRHLSEHSTMVGAVLLSPGLDYHGVTTEDAVQNLAVHQHVLIAVSEEDEYAFLSSKKLHQLNGSIVELVEREGLGHGTHMLEKSMELFQEVTDWMNKYL